MVKWMSPELDTSEKVRPIAFCSPERPTAAPFETRRLRLHW